MPKPDHFRKTNSCTNCRYSDCFVYPIVECTKHNFNIDETHDQFLDESYICDDYQTEE